MRVKHKAARTLHSSRVLREGSEGGRSFILDCMRGSVQQFGDEEDIASLGNEDMVSFLLDLPYQKSSDYSPYELSPACNPT